MGSGTVFAQRHRAGNEYIFESKPGWLTLATLGLYTRPWMHYRLSGRAAVRRPLRRRLLRSRRSGSRIPQPGVRQHAARRRVLGGAHRVAVHATRRSARLSRRREYTDPRATEYITATLIKRRDKVLRTWLAGVNPLVDFALSDGGELTFANAAVDAGVESRRAAIGPCGRASTTRRANRNRLARRLGPARACVHRRVYRLRPTPTSRSRSPRPADLRRRGKHRCRPTSRAPDRSGNWWESSGFHRACPGRPRDAHPSRCQIDWSAVDNRLQTVSSTLIRAKYLSFASTSVHGARLRAGACDHLVHRPRILVPASSRLRQSSSVSFHCLNGERLPFLETAELLVGRDVEPVLDEHDPVLDELLLELLDLASTRAAIRPAPRILPRARPARGRTSCDRRSSSVPLARQVAPEAPEIVMRALLVGRRGDRNDLDMSARRAPPSRGGWRLPFPRHPNPSKTRIVEMPLFAGLRCSTLSRPWRSSSCFRTSLSHSRAMSRCSRTVGRFTRAAFVSSFVCARGAPASAEAAARLAEPLEARRRPPPALRLRAPRG